MIYHTTPFNKPPEFCDDHGKPLEESTHYEDIKYDIFTGYEQDRGRWTKIRWCPVYYPRHKFTSWSIKEGDENWIRRRDI